MRRRRRRKKRNNIVINILLLIFIVLFVFSSIKIIYWYLDNQKSNKVFRSISNDIKVIDRDNKYNIDFFNLKKKNSDTVAFIRVNGTNIEYPVVKTDNNDYYLNHSFDKSVNSAGWVFANFINKFDDTDKNIVLFAHARRDGSMFGSLTKTLDREWINNKDNLIINFTTINNRYLFKVFSIYYINTTDDYININYNEELLNTIIKRSIYKLDEEISISDKVLTLSTCYNNSKKLVVHAKLIYKSL